jgi:DNA topoisomerase-1
MKCPRCGKDLKVRSGKFGEFIACSGYPKCHYKGSTKKIKTPLEAEADKILSNRGLDPERCVLNE